MDKNLGQLEILRRFRFPDELTTDEDLIFWGQCLAVLRAFQKQALRLLHRSHTGTNGCISRTRQAYQWAGMPQQVRQTVANYSTSRKLYRWQTRGLVETRPVPGRLRLDQRRCLRDAKPRVMVHLSSFLNVIIFSRRPCGNKPDKTLPFGRLLRTAPVCMLQITRLRYLISHNE